MNNVLAFQPRATDRSYVVLLPMEPEIECSYLTEALRDLFKGIPRSPSDRKPTGKVVAKVAGTPLRFTISTEIRTYQAPFAGTPSDILFDTMYQTQLREHGYGSCAGIHEYLVLKAALRSMGWMPTTWMRVEPGVLCFNYEQGYHDLMTLTVEFGP